MTDDLVSYGGPLTDAHFRAVARIALRAHGLPAMKPQVHHLPRVMSTGRDLRDWAIPRMLASRGRGERYRSLADGAPWAWQRLPYALGFGAACVGALHRCAVSEDDGRTKVLAAALNAAIVLLDSSQNRPTDDGALVHHVAGALLTSCGELAAEMACDERVGELFTKRIEALGAPAPDAGQTARIEGPEGWTIAGAQALTDLVELAIAPHRRLPSEAWIEAERLGRIRCLADGLADLAIDARAGLPNLILARYSPRPGRLSDPEMYSAIHVGAGELAALLVSGEPAPNERPAAIVDRLKPLRELQALAVARLDWSEAQPYAVGIPAVATVHEGTRPPLQLAVDALLAEAATGFAHSAHHLRFPRGRQGATRRETHPATLLVRAVTLDALLDAKVAGLVVPDAALCRETMELLLAKHPMVRGGWSYIDAVPELPPDADDLGQVIQELARVGGTELACACDEAVRLTVGAHRASGGFSTWVLDPSMPGALDRQMSAYISVIGGTGVHPEVVANLLGGLQLYDPARYVNEIQREVAYLERKQDPGGWWDSVWYAGRFYGTYKAVAVLSRLSAGTDATLRAGAFLESSQREDGGWGEATSDPLACAHALLAYACVGGPIECFRRGAEFLLAAQHEDGTWPAVPWVQFPTLDGMQSYSSSAATTTFALRACLAAAATAEKPGQEKRM